MQFEIFDRFLTWWRRRCWTVGSRLSWRRRRGLGRRVVHRGVQLQRLEIVACDTAQVLQIQKKKFSIRCQQWKIIESLTIVSVPSFLSISNNSFISGVNVFLHNCSCFPPVSPICPTIHWLMFLIYNSWSVLTKPLRPLLWNTFFMWTIKNVFTVSSYFFTPFNSFRVNSSFLCFVFVNFVDFITDYSFLFWIIFPNFPNYQPFLSFNKILSTNASSFSFRILKKMFWKLFSTMFIH